MSTSPSPACTASPPAPRSPARCSSPSPKPPPPRPRPRLPKPRRHFRHGAPPRPRSAASWWRVSASCCARTRPIWPRWSRIEAGKITSEALGEVQEMIDICDFAVGLSRQLYGRTIASERPGHRLMETWHPLGVVGVITAFNFPVAVWAWNTAIALVCGDTVVWKPSELTPLTALACQALIERAAADVGAPRRGEPAGPRRPRGRRAAGRRPAGRAGVGHRLGPDGPAGRPAGRRSGSAGCCSNSAATTRRSSPRRPTSIWRCAASSSPRRAPRASAAPRCAG